jgi:hypothetical protein
MASLSQAFEDGIRDFEFQNRHMKKNLLDLIKYSNDLTLTKLEDNYICKSLKNIKNAHDVLYIALDLEFQSYKTDGNKYHKDNDKVSFAREFGAILLLKNKSDVYYIGYIFVNFDNMTNYDNKLTNYVHIQEKYSNVTPNTSAILKQNDSKIVNSMFPSIEDLKLAIKNLYEDICLNKEDNIKPFIENIIKSYKNIFFENVPDEFLYIKKQFDWLESDVKELEKINDSPENEIRPKLKKIIQTQYNNTIIEEMLYKVDEYDKKRYDLLHNLYYDNQSPEVKRIMDDSKKSYFEDSLVQKRILKNNYKKFLTSFQNIINHSIFIIKGPRDFEALDNTYKLITNTFMNPNPFIQQWRLYDIELFNNFSSNFFGNARLETTYNGIIKTDLYQKHMKKDFDEIIKSIYGISETRAHDPVFDAIMALIVAIATNLSINNCLMKWEPTEPHQCGGSYEYLIQDNITKRKYIKLKKQLSK